MTSMQRRTIKQVLMERDDLSGEDADNLIAEGKEAFYTAVDEGDMEAAECICEDYFGLESDYIDELI